MIWTLWWVWVIAGVALAVVEVLVPGYIFLGFAIGAMVTGSILLIGGPEILSLPLLVMAFALLSLASWLMLRRWVGVRKGQIKLWDTDINDL